MLINPKGGGDPGQGWGFDVLDYLKGEYFEIVYPPQGCMGTFDIIYYVCFNFCTHWLHLPQVENFDSSDHVLCPKGMDFDFFVCKSQIPTPSLPPPLGVNIDKVHHVNKYLIRE
jgi:hypothetical protein